MEADKRRLFTPNPELACLIRQKFTDEEIKEMGLQCIISMHHTINDSDGNPALLGASRHETGRILDTYSGSPGCRWNHEYGFAFAVSQTDAQS